MPCGHFLCSVCVKKWLHQSPDCPLCRAEVESYTDQPAPSTGNLQMVFSFPFGTLTGPQVETPHFSDTAHVTPRQLHQGALHFNPSSVTPTSSFPNPLRLLNRTSPRSPSLQATDHVLFDTTVCSRITSTVADRPDLACAQKASGLCSHHLVDESLLRLECGHAFHADCLELSMIIEGYAIDQEERRSHARQCRR
jgi:hypothetical protein